MAKIGWSARRAAWLAAALAGCVAGDGPGGEDVGRGAEALRDGVDLHDLAIVSAGGARSGRSPRRAHVG